MDELNPVIMEMDNHKKNYIGGKINFCEEPITLDLFQAGRGYM